MIVRTVLLNLALAALYATAAQSSEVAMVKDMVSLDKAYVPALLLTGADDASKAETAVKRLVDSWTGFEAKWKDYVDDEAWTSGFKRISQVINEAADRVSSQDLKRAHKVLGEVRRTLWRLRSGQDIPYFVDLLTSFHQALLDVEESIVLHKNLTMTSDELDVAENLLLEATVRWKKVTDTFLDKILYQIDYYHIGEVAYYREEGAQILQALTDALSIEDRSILAGKVEKLRGSFQHLFRLFGKFDGLE